MQKVLTLITALLVSLCSYAAPPKWWHVADVTALSRIKPGNTVDSRTDGDIALVDEIESTDAPFYGIYVYSKTSAETDDSINVVDCVSGPGQWLLVTNGINLSGGDTLEKSLRRDNKIYSYYSYATDGGAVGNITLRGDVFPNGTIPTKCIYWVDTAFTSGGSATMTLQYNYTGTSWATIQSSTAYGTAGTAELHETTLNTASTTRYKIDKTGGASIRLVVGTAAVTAGKISMLCEYMYPEN